MKQAYVKSRVRVTDSGLIRMKIRTDVCKKHLIMMMSMRITTFAVSDTVFSVKYWRELEMWVRGSLKVTGNGTTR